jgi:hypothetical protein
MCGNGTEITGHDQLLPAVYRLARDGSVALVDGLPSRHSRIRKRNQDLPMRLIMLAALSKVLTS